MRRRNLGHLGKDRILAVAKTRLLAREAANSSSSEPTSRIMKLRQKFRNALLLGLMSFSQSLPTNAADFYWDPDPLTVGNLVDGSGLGGSGTWDTTTLDSWWDLATQVAWPNSALDANAIFTEQYSPDAPESKMVTVVPGINANRLTFQRSGYALTGGSITMLGATPSFYVQAGETATIDTQISGTGGLTKLGAGSVRLTNLVNNYTGATSIQGGSIIISSPDALGGVGTVSITSGNTTPLNNTQYGFSGGSLVLDGTSSGMTFTRDIDFEGRGPLGDRSSAILSIGNNTLSGTLRSAISPLPLSPTATIRNSRINAVNGTLTVSGTLNVGGAVGATFTTLGGVNQAGVSNFSFAVSGTPTGTLTGTGSIEKSGSGTLFLNSLASNAGFTGTVRVSGGSAGGQSSVRVTDALVGGNNVFGGNTGTNNASAIDMRGGVLEFRNDGSMNIGKNLFQNNSSTYFTGPGVGGSGVNGITTLGTFRLASNTTATFNSFNGFGMTFGAWTQENTGNPNTITNNMGGTLLFTGNAWNNTDGTARTLNFGGNGNTTINGFINATVSAHTLAKSGTGVLTIRGQGTSTLAAVNVTGGALAITDFRSINNTSTAAISLGNATTAAGNLIIGGVGTPTQAGLTTSKAITLNTTTVSPSIYANQSGSNPVVLNGAITRTTQTSGGLILGGSNTLDNIINSVIPNAGVGGVTKVGSGTWVLAGANTYTGATTVTNGTLKIRDTFSGSSRDVLSDSSAIGFSPGVANVGAAGGTFTYVGGSGAASSEILGTLLPGGGAGTVHVTAGAGGTANLTFASVDGAAGQTTTAASSASSTVTVASTAGLVPGMRVTGTGVSAQGTIVSITNATQFVMNANQNIATSTPLTFNRANGGATINFDPDASSTITIGTVSTIGLLNSYSYFKGSDFAYAPATVDAILRAPVYGTDAGFVNAGAALSLNNHNLVAGNTSTGAGTVLSLKIDGNQTVTQTGLLTVRQGAAGTSGGILVTGGTSTITGTGVTTGTNADLIVRVNDGATLNLNSPVTATTTGGFTKTGGGTLVIGATNAYTTGGSTNLLEGTIQLNTGGRLSANSVNLLMRQGTVLDLNGISTSQSATTSSIGAFNGTGTVTNSSATAVNFAVGGGTTGGTGTWNGTINQTNGTINVVKMGTTNSQTWNGLSNYTGSTTIGVAGTGTTGSLTVATLANIGVDSSIGRGDATSDATNAASLIFGGTTGGLIYTGNVFDTDLVVNTVSASTNRLFTLAGTAAGAGASISSTVTNNNAIVWSNTGAVAFGPGATAQTLILTGTSTGDNTFNPQLTDNAANVTSLSKTNTGQWKLGNSNNTYTGTTSVANGILALNNNGALPANSPVVLGATTTSGILQMSGTFARDLTTTPTAGTGTITWGGTTGGGGFAAYSTPLTVTLNGGDGLTWGTSGFVGTGGTQSLIFNSASALADVTFTNAINFDTANRTITVNDNINTGADYATVSGVLSGTGGGLLKNGAGILRVGNVNSYTGTTTVQAGTLVVSSLGASGVEGTSSVGAVTVADFDNTNAVLIGNGTTGGARLQYVGSGETSNRKIQLNTNTALTGATGTTAVPVEIHADGSGSLVLTNVANDLVTGSKDLRLRGTNTGNNMITSLLADNSGALGVTVDGGASWILTGVNTYTGGTSASGGALGIGDNSALGSGALTNVNSNVFAYGQDRVLSNAVVLSNNAANGWMGDYSLTFNGVTNMAAAANNVTTSNNIIAGKALTFANGVTANALTANRVWTIDGTGETIINGTFTTATAFGVRFDINGGGTLNLGTNGATSDWNKSGNTADVDRGTLKFSANNAIPTGLTTSGPVLMTPEAVAGDIATIDLNGTEQTFNAFTATSDGTSIITNTAAGSATLIVGANNTATTFGTGGNGTYSITQPAGAINLSKVGTGTANFTGTLGNTGTVTATGGTLNLNSATGATTAVANGGAVNFKGGLTTPGNLLSVTTDNGGLVSFASGAGTSFDNLTTLSLSSTASSGLELDVGDSGVDRLTAATATVANVTTLFIKDVDITSGATYNLIVNAGGGLGTPGNYALNLPGYSGSILNVSPTLVSLTAGTLVTSDVYWNNGTGLDGGNLTSAWNTVDGVTNNTNFSGALAGTPSIQLAESLPGKGQKVIFQADNVTGGAPLATTLEQSFSINSLEFRPSTIAADTSRTISIAPGAVSSNSLTIRPSATADGINLQAGATGTVSISAPVVAGTDQTWTVADAPVEIVGGVITGTTNVAVASTAGLRPGMTVSGTGITAGTTIASIVDGTNFTLSAAATNATVNILALQLLNVSGALSGAGNLTKDGAGIVVLSGANGTLGGTYTNIAGSTQVTNLSALGGLVGAPGSGADITVSGGSLAYNNGTSGTFVNDITLNGGVLSVGGNNQTYSGNVNVASNSNIIMRDQASSSTFTTTARNITLSGVVTGTSAITVDSVTTVSGGNQNQITGNLVFNKAASTWNGALNMTRGSVFFQNVAGSGNATPYFGYDGIINFNQFGRVTYRNLDGQTLNRTATINVAASAIGELNIDNVDTLLATNYVVNQQGAVNLNGGSILRVTTDNGSALNLTGGVVLNGNASITVQGSAEADNLLTISGTGISGFGNLAINDEAGVWGVTSRTIHINAPSTFVGNSSLNEGTLILGNATALNGVGNFTVTGTSTIQASTDLSGVNAVANPTTLGSTAAAANLTVSGTNNLQLSGAFTGTGADAARTLTNSLTGPAALTISGGVNLVGPLVVNTATRNLTIAGAGATTISGVVADGNALFANGITKTGAGTLTLSNTNLYTGVTTLSSGAGVNNGIILATAANALGTGGYTSVQNGAANTIGQLQLTGGITLGNSSFATSGPGSDGTVNGMIRSVSGANTIGLIGGSFNLIGGAGNTTLRADAGASLTVNGNVGVGNGVNFARTMILVGGGDFTFGGTIQNSNGTPTVAEVISINSGNTGLTTLNGTNTYTGTTNSGVGNTLIAGSIQAFGIESATTVDGTLRLASFSNSIGSLAGSITGIVENANATPATLTTGGNNTSTTFSGLIQDGTGGGALSLAKTGTGAMTLSGTNTYTGGTTFNAGTLVVNTEASLGATSGALTVTGNSSVQLAAAFDTTRNYVLDAAVLTVDTQAFNQTNSGTVSGIGGLAKSGSGALTLLGTNTYTGGTTFNAGTLVVNTEASLGATSGALTVTGNSSVQLAAAFDTTRNYVLDAGVLTVDTQAFNQTNSGTVSGIGGLAKSGSGALTLSGTNTYSGTTNVGAGGSLVAGSTQAFGVNSAASVDGTLALAGNSNALGSLAGSGTVENANATAATLTIGGDNTSTVFSGLIQDGAGGGALSLLKTGTGIQTISGANTFSGATVINGGVLLVNSVGGLGTGGVTVNAGELGGTGGVVSAAITLAGGTIAPGSSIGTLGVGSISGNGSLDIEYDSSNGTIDLLNVSGALDISSMALNFSDFNGAPVPLTQPFYVFATYGTLVGSNFTSISGLPENYGVDYLFNSGSSIAIVAVPEPGTIALLTVAIVGGGLYRRSRNQKKNAVKS